ncbi:MAG: flavodoxin [Sphaerochaetaceae bacterium]|nr:flavodoxin [Sphaerochaetaceae bacterium]
MKSVVVYWSMTGNTKQMADAIKDGGGENCDIFEVNETSASNVAKYDSIALGCPAMGNEVLEENEFEPFFEELLPLLKSQKVFLFGSYDWGDGEWMRNWQNRCESYNINLISEGFITNLEPDDSTIANLTEIGNTISN